MQLAPNSISHVRMLCKAFVASAILTLLISCRPIVVVVVVPPERSGDALTAEPTSGKRQRSILPMQAPTEPIGTAIDGEEHVEPAMESLDESVNRQRKAEWLEDVRAEIFDGTSRGVAKSTLPDHEHVDAKFTSLEDWHNSHIEPSSMARRLTSKSRRVDEENRIESIECYIVAFKFNGSDKDFHVTVANSPEVEEDGWVVTNFEVSGLPRPGVGSVRNRERLEAARNQFIDLMLEQPIRAVEEGTPGKGGYNRLVTPLHVTITGAPFYDIDHGRAQLPGTVPKRWTKYQLSAWELHPIESIVPIE